ncbi:MAG: hypothetical protein PHR00_01590 [Patescibacteria group bacterium]|nr:hypothetical protein [Patescibacteria group bacterium]
MILNIFILALSLVVIIKGATLATKYAARLAESFHLSKYAVGFFIIAIISILPETFIAINSAIEGVPAFGLGILFGSNVADLTLVFTITLFFVGRGLKVENKILKNRKIYPLMLLLPLVLGLDGFYGRIDGLVLVIVGGLFYYTTLRGGVEIKLIGKKENRFKDLLGLLAGMIFLLAGSHFTISSTSALAINFGVNPIFIGMLIVSVGATMPELSFSIKSIKKKDDSLAIGDVLGTVLADATIVVGAIALISPFYFSRTIIFVSGIFMLLASILLYHFMYTGRVLSRKEAIYLFLFWLIFILTEFFINKVFYSF